MRDKELERRERTGLHDFQFTFDLVIIVQLLQLKSELIDFGRLQEVKTLCQPNRQ